MGASIQAIYPSAGTLNTIRHASASLSESRLSRDPVETAVSRKPVHTRGRFRRADTNVHRVVDEARTIADGARTPSLGAVTFPLVLHYVDDMVTVSEDAIRRAMLFFWERMKLIVEPTGALALAALLDGAVSAPDARIGVLISGGNVDLRYALTLFEGVGKS